MLQIGEGDGLYRDDHRIAIEETGSVGLTAFCPVCGAQAFGYMTLQLDLDLVDHMNLFHRPRPDAGRA